MILEEDEDQTHDGASRAKKHVDRGVESEVGAEITKSGDALLTRRRKPMPSNSCPRFKESSGARIRILLLLHTESTAAAGVPSVESSAREHIPANHIWLSRSDLFGRDRDHF